MEDRTAVSEAAKLTAAALVVYALAHAIVDARMAFLLGFFAVVLATVLCFPIDWMARKIPRPLAGLITLVVCVGAVAAAVAVIVPVVRDEIAALPDQLRGARDQVSSLIGDGGGQVVEKAAAAVPQVAKHAVPIVAVTTKLLSTVVLTVVLAFFLAGGRDAIRGGVRRLVPREQLTVFDTWWDRCGQALRKWVGGIVISMTLMGVLVGVGLWVAGIKGAFFLALVTFFCTFVPYLGAIVSAIPGIAVGLAQSSRLGLIAVGIYIGVHMIEGYIVEPLVMRRAVAMHPAMLLFWQAAMGMVFGIPGVIVATPLLAVVQASVEYLWVERRVQPVSRS